MNNYFDFEQSIEEIDEKIKLLEKNENSETKLLKEYKIINIDECFEHLFDHNSWGL